MEDFNQRWNTIASMLNTKMKHVCKFLYLNLTTVDHLEYTM